MTSLITAIHTPIRSPHSGAVLPPPQPPIPNVVMTPAMIYAVAMARTQAQLQWEEATRAYWRAVALSN